MSASSIDPDIQAAFSDTPASASSHSNIDADILDAYKADSESSGGGPLDQLHEMGSGIYHGIVGGYKGLGAILTGGDAAKAVEDEQAKAYKAPVKPLTGYSPTMTAAIKGMGELPSTNTVGDFAEAHGASPAVSTLGAVLPTALSTMAGARAAPAAMGAGDAQAAMNAAQSGKSMGAASTAADITGASPELQKAIIDTTRKTGGAVNPDVLNRRLEADSLPVKMNLTEGQATQDPSIISNEMNMRGKHKELADAYNQQNGQLIDNLRTIREQAGPDVFSTNPVEHGDTLIQAYKDKAAVADADISAKYKALKDANGGQFPVDAEALLKNAGDALHQNLLFDHAPKAVMSTLGRLSDQGNMSFENYESLRTNLARIQRSSQDGNERAAASVIRNSMEELPLAPGAANLKPLADTARNAARTQFQALDADPAYKAAVNESVPPDRFVQKFITGPTATRDSVATMKTNLADNDRASQTMGVAALDHLRDSAKVDSMGNGNFAAASFNKNLENMRPKLQSVLPPEQAQHLDALGNVARYTTAQPKGSFVNNSNTLVGALAGHGANVLEGVANVKAGGIPVGTMVRGAIGKRSDAAAVRRALDPASGLERLKESQ